MNLLSNLNKYIFRPYDIRGVYPTDINQDVAYTIGVGFGSYIQDLGFTEAVIGHDNRLSSPNLEDALISGITNTGVDVIRLGLVTTPMYYYALLKLNIESGIMITASHNPKDENGFKIAFQNGMNAKGDEITNFYNYIIKGDFKRGTGKIKDYDIQNEYVNLIHNSLNFGNKRVKVVIDPGNGTTSIIARKLYESFENIDLIAINDESDGTFPNHHPDPSVEDNLKDLKKKVLEIGADVGISFDGDGDRVGIVDEHGEFIPGDKFMIIIIRDIISKCQNKTFLYDVKCTKALEDEIVRLGGSPFLYRSGASYTHAGVVENNFPFGGELAGHIFFNDRFPGFDSGLYAGLRIVEILSKSDKKCSELLDGINNYYSTPELKFASNDAYKLKVIDKIKEYVINKKYNYIDIDGIRISFNDGWILIRVSNTGPNITARAEANSESRLETLKNEFISLINKYNQQDLYN